MAHTLVKNFFLIILVASLLLSILNSLFTLADMNSVLSLFGFYGVQRNHKLALLGYILFCSIFSTVVDLARLLLWLQYLQNHTLGYITSLGNYYIILLAFGMVLKVIGGIFAWFLWRGLSRAGESGRNVVAERESLLLPTPSKMWPLSGSREGGTTTNPSSTNVVRSALPSLSNVTLKTEPLSAANVTVSSATKSAERHLTTSYTSLLKDPEVSSKRVYANDSA